MSIPKSPHHPVCESVINILDRCAGITDAGVAALAAGNPELEVLRLDGCGRLTDVGLAAVAESCRRLRVCFRLYLLLCYPVFYVQEHMVHTWFTVHGLWLRVNGQGRGQVAPQRWKHSVALAADTDCTWRKLTLATDACFRHIQYSRTGSTQIDAALPRACAGAVAAGVLASERRGGGGGRAARQPGGTGRVCRVRCGARHRQGARHLLQVSFLSLGYRSQTLCGHCRSGLSAMASPGLHSLRRGARPCARHLQHHGSCSRPGHLLPVSPTPRLPQPWVSAFMIPPQRGSVPPCCIGAITCSND